MTINSNTNEGDQDYDQERVYHEDLDSSLDEIISRYDDLDSESKELLESLGILAGGELSKKIEKAISEDGYFEIKVCDDHKAIVSIYPPKGQGKSVVFESIIKEAKKKGIIYGVQTELLQKSIQEVKETGDFQKNILLAVGSLPDPSKGAHIQYLFDHETRKKVNEIDGRIDHRGDLNVVNVCEGQVLARYIPEQEGATGYDIYGHSIIVQGDDIEESLSVGENVFYNEEKREYISKINGYVKIQNMKISVLNIYEIHGDICMKTGNILIQGELKITGSVLDGFSVRASGDIYIDGTVGAASVISDNGSVYIRKGIAGKQRSHVSAKNEVRVKYIENGTVYAGETITVEEAILNSDIYSGKDVIVDKGNGRVSGGVIRLARLLKVKTLGAPNEPKTSVKMLFKEEYRRLMEKLEIEVLEIKKVIDRVKENLVAISDSEERKALELKKQMLVLNYKENKIRKKMNEIEGEALSNGDCSVVVTDVIYPKVLVKIGSHILNFERKVGPRKKVQLNEGFEEVVVKDWKHNEKY